MGRFLQVEKPVPVKWALPQTYWSRLLATLLGVLAIRRRDIQAHRCYMQRSYAIAFAAVTIRFYFHPARRLGIPFEYVYPASLWLSILTNIVAVEAMLRWPRMGKVFQRMMGSGWSKYRLLNSASRQDL